MGKNFVISDFYCTCCGKKGTSLPRKKGQFREEGHLKKLYCINCKAEKNHVEIRSVYSSYELEDFLIEYNYGNFDLEGNRIKPYKMFRNELRKGLIAI